MNYSLGNMLSRGGALNPDGLSLDLAFAADKTLTARKGPTPTFTRASTATFVGSNGLIQSAAINTPRFDHDPVTLACKGLLIEEQRTNLCLRSEEFNVSPWIKNAAITVTANAQIAPDGTLTADTVDNSTAGANFLAQDVNVTAGTSYVFSFYAKKGTGSSFIARIRNQTNATIFLLLDYSSQVTTSAWTRVSIPFTAPVGCTVVQLRIRNDDGVGSVHLWGAQLEAGSFPTSYIPTTSTAAPRSADVCSITGADFTSFWNPSEGTLFASGITQGYLAMASSGANANQIAIFRNPSPLYMRFDVAVGGSYGAQINGSTIIGDSYNKIAGAYATNNVRAAFNGVLGTQDTTVTIPLNLTTLNIGSQSLGVAPHNGHITHIQYFKKRLPNAKLQSITTP